MELNNPTGVPKLRSAKSRQQQYESAPSGQHMQALTAPTINPIVGPTTLQRQGLSVPTCTHANMMDALSKSGSLLTGSGVNRETQPGFTFEFPAVLGRLLGLLISLAEGATGGMARPVWVLWGRSLGHLVALAVVAVTCLTSAAVGELR